MTVEIENNECSVLCSICGGECCRTKPGIESPMRFLREGDAGEALREALSSGLWVLDRHYGIPSWEAGEVLYPRPATRSEAEKGLLYGEGKAGDCVFLEGEGCVLPFEERPLMCRTLEPDASFECESSWKRPDAAREWYPHQESVRKAMKEAETGSRNEESRE